MTNYGKTTTKWDILEAVCGVIGGMGNELVKPVAHNSTFLS